ncbi:hypothetical protein G3T14_21350 [Methylobacterium sp. BTF04]|uniref:hypothetical protein n=1 Tax=Methylobacterium sp. BTF04 TaxID=2708300 RepID=UPI0013CF8A06|nr:hypothetical protein [Methylobacterium sp. BTF04]NEU14633.1 hypothetical protein [Methylobacterium sp. BTF04]
MSASSNEEFLSAADLTKIISREAQSAREQNLFGPDTSVREQKTARAGATGREDFAMLDIAQPRLRAKEITHGIGDDAVVTDLSALLLDKSASLQSDAEARSGYRHVGRIEMSITEWSSVADNPRQRDTELHARKAKHLKEYDPIHRFVSMAVLPDGRRIKLDGHTRVFLWSRGEALGPQTVFVEVYSCRDAASAEALYSKFDSQAAVETGADKVAGAARRHGLEFKTGMLRAGRYGSAVKRLYAYSTKTWNASWQDHDFVYDAVGHYAKELRLLDLTEPSPSQFPSGIVMAALATMKRRGEAALPFWKEYAVGGGTKVGSTMDGVQALIDAVVKAKQAARGKGSDGGAGQQLALLGKGILTFEAKRASQPYKVGKHGGVRSMDEDVLLQYLRYTAGA